MRDYTKHQVWRIRDLNDKFVELVIAKGTLNFLPGDSAGIYSLESPSPIFIASSMSEAWVRLILNRDLFPNFDYTQKSIKLDSEIKHNIPDLIYDDAPNFLVTSEGIGAFFSYASTFPDRKCKVCYLGDHQITPAWVKHYHKVVSVKDIKKAANLYVIGENDIIQRKAAKVLNVAKKVCLL